VTRVVRDAGSYDVLDQRGYKADDLCLAFLGQLTRIHPAITALTDLPDGSQAMRDHDATWDHSVLGWRDRRASRRAWRRTEPDPQTNT
jgi:hypothetical protein